MTSAAPVPRIVVASLWCGVVLLTTIGVAAAAGRIIFLSDLATRAEPGRLRLFQALGREDPLILERPEEARRLDRRFAVHPIVTLLHVLPGGVYLLLAPFQFSSRVRNRHLGFHRWSGRVLVLVGLTMAVTGLFFGVLKPYGGPGEVVAVALVGGLFLTAVGKAWQAIRRGEVRRHREWMIRAFALALAIATVRVVGTVLGIVLAPAGLRFGTLLTLSMWLGWAINLGAAEVWIARTRPHAEIVGPEPE